MINIHPVYVIMLLSALLIAAVVKGMLVARRHKRGRTEPLIPRAAHEGEGLASLGKRVSVLERITVERENTLEREIEELRDH